MKPAIALLGFLISGVSCAPAPRVECSGYRYSSDVEQILYRVNRNSLTAGYQEAWGRFSGEVLQEYCREFACSATPTSGVRKVSFPPADNLSEQDKAFLKMQMHAANLMNCDTTGYRARLWRPSRVVISMQQAALMKTDRDLDLAVDGEGFFRVTLPDGRVAFTRLGTLDIDSEGRLVTPEGYFLDPPVTVPNHVIRVFVDQTGLVQGFDPQTPEELQELAQLMLTRFRDDSSLQGISPTFFAGTEKTEKGTCGKPGESGLGVIRQGFLEESNTDVVIEAIELQRAITHYKNIKTK